MPSNKSNLLKIGKTYYLRYKVNGKQIKQSLKTEKLDEAIIKRKAILNSARDVKTEADVIHKVARAKKIYDPKKFPIATLWLKFEKHLQRKGSSEDATRRYQFRIDQFIDWLRLHCKEAVNLSDISDAVAQEYADYLGGTDIANKTYNETMNALALIIEAFREEADIAKNPFRKENLARKKKLSVSRKEFTEEQAKTILNNFNNIKIADKEEIEVLFYLGMFAGLRLKDACLLKWESVDMPSNRIYLIPEKTKQYGTMVNIPLHPALREKLNTAQSWNVNQYVLPNLAERYNRNRDNVRKLTAKVFEFNGYTTTIDKENMNESRNKSACQYGYHSLRYTFVSVCAKAGVPLTLVQEIVGHKNPAMTKHYTKFDDKYRQNAINSLQMASPISEEEALRKSILTRIETVSGSRLKQVSDFLEEIGG